MVRSLTISALMASAVALPASAAGVDEGGNGFIKGLAYAINDPVTHAAFAALLVFLLIVWRLGGFKAALGRLDQRAENIRREIEEAQTLREQAAEALAQAERRQQDADKEAEAIIEQAKRDAKALIEETKRELAEKIARREAQAEQRIARAEAEAANDVRRAAADAATEAARRVLMAQPADIHFERALKDIERTLS